MTRPRVLFVALASALLLSTMTVAVALPGPAVGASPTAVLATTESSDYVARTLRVLEGDDPADQVEALATRLDNGETRTAIVTERVNGSAYADFVTARLFTEILQRPADPGGLDFWSDRLTDRREYAVRAELLSSAEFLNRNGGTAEGFVTGVFETYLGRTPDAAGLEYWSGQAGTTRGERFMTALRLMASNEARTREVGVQYGRILARTPDAAGLSVFTTRLRTMGVESVTIDLAVSGEAANLATRRDAAFVLLPGNTIATVDPETLESLGDPVTIATTGATANLGVTAGTSLVSIDVRPFTGVLFGMGSDGQLYSLNPANGTASKIGPPLAAVAGDDVDIDFNPAVDRLRIVTAAGENIRVNPDTGAQVDGDPGTDGVQNDGPLAYAAGDANEGDTPGVAGAAYTNSTPGGPTPTTTRLFDLDLSQDVLAFQDPPNAGTLNTRGSLGLDVSAVGGFDVSGSTGRAWAVLDDGNGFATYRVDLNSGRAFRQATTDEGTEVLGMALTQARPATTGSATLLAVDGGTTSLVSVDPAQPGTALATHSLTGITGGTSLVAIDVRPATGMLYALGSDGQLYVLGAPKGATPTVVPAEKVGTPLAPAAVDSAGFDFNPAVDRLRIVAGIANLRVNPDTAVLVDGNTMVDGVQPDGDLAYADGDVNNGTGPDVRSAGYTNSPFGGVATSTQLFDLDGVADVLALQNPPNAGTLGTVGALGIEIGSVGGFDVSGATGTAFAVQTDGDGNPKLYTVALATGAATVVGDLPAADTIAGFALR